MAQPDVPLHWHRGCLPSSSMAIMWEPPKSASIRPSLAELAWRMWLTAGVKANRDQPVAEDLHHQANGRADPPPHGSSGG